ncbi:hypothetical protein ABZ351_28110 [Streptomyces microflavus]|uniref:hypothetical protein n=1 Tax=Streptomyces microflavus TaxID=1919 RepID=UPI0033ECF33F
MKDDEPPIMGLRCSGQLLLSSAWSRRTQVLVARQVEGVIAVRAGFGPPLLVSELFQGPGAETMRTGDAGLELGGAAVCLVERSLQCLHASGQTAQGAGVLVDNPVQLARVDVQYRLDVERQEQADTLSTPAAAGNPPAPRSRLDSL